MNVVGSRFGDDVDLAAGRAAEFGVCAAGDNLKLLDGLKRNIDRGALAADLFAEETVVVVAAVEANVVKDAALAVDVDFVAVGSLRDADARGQSQQVFKFTTEDGSRCDGGFIQGGGRLGGRCLDHRNVGHDDLLGNGGDLYRDRNGEHLADGEIDVLLNDGGEAGLGDGERVTAGCEVQESEMAVAVGGFGADVIGIEILCFDGGAWNAAPFFVQHVTLDGAGRTLRLTPTG